MIYVLPDRQYKKGKTIHHITYFPDRPDGSVVVVSTKSIRGNVKRKRLYLDVIGAYKRSKSLTMVDWTLTPHDIQFILKECQFIDMANLLAGGQDGVED